MPVVHANNASALLANPIVPGDLTIIVEAGQGAQFPVIAPGSEDTFYLTIEDRRIGAREVVLATGRTADSFTVVRAQDGTTALTFDSGVNVSNRITSGFLNGIEERIVGSEETSAAAAVAAAAALAGIAGATEDAAEALSVANATAASLAPIAASAAAAEAAAASATTVANQAAADAAAVLTVAEAADDKADAATLAANEATLAATGAVESANIISTDMATLEASLHPVAKNGDYNSLVNKPVLIFDDDLTTLLTDDLTVGASRDAIRRYVEALEARVVALEEGGGGTVSSIVEPGILDPGIVD